MRTFESLRDSVRQGLTPLHPGRPRAARAAVQSRPPEGGRIFARCARTPPWRYANSAPAKLQNSRLSRKVARRCLGLPDQFFKRGASPEGARQARRAGVAGSRWSAHAPATRPAVHGRRRWTDALSTGGRASSWFGGVVVWPRTQATKARLRALARLLELCAALERGGLPKAV